MNRRTRSSSQLERGKKSLKPVSHSVIQKKAKAAKTAKKKLVKAAKAEVKSAYQKVKDIKEGEPNFKSDKLQEPENEETNSADSRKDGENKARYVLEINDGKRKDKGEVTNLISVRLTEHDAGITEYISNHSGFSGIIKQRYSDFHVNEIDSDGNVVTLTTTDIPVEKSPRTEDSLEYLKSSLPEELFKKLVLLFDSKVDEVEIEATDLSKDARRKLHLAVLNCGKSTLMSNTVEKGNKKYITVKKKNLGKPDTRSSDWPSERGGDYVHFALHKENMDTMETVNIIAGKLRIRPSMITYAGTKDRRAKTTQLMSVRKIEPSRLTAISKGLKGIELGNYKFQKYPLELGDLKGNRFRIVLRNVKGSDQQIEQAITSLKTKGFINYYGLQRFGTSLTVPTYEIGKALLQGKWQKAVELILKPRGEDESCRFLSEARKLWWETRDASSAFKVLRNKNKTLEGKLLLGLTRSGASNYLSALDNVPRNTRLMYLHSYQSLLWNKVVSRRIKEFGLKPLVGDLVLQGNEIIPSEPDDFAEPVQQDSLAKVSGGKTMVGSNKHKPKVSVLTEANLSGASIFDVVLPLPGHDIEYPKNEIGVWFEELLHKDGLSSAKLKQTVKTYSLGGTYRKLVVCPTDVNWKIMHYSDPQKTLVLSDLEQMQKVDPPKDVKDGIYKALLLDFCLPSSTYATMAIREILKIDTSCYNQSLLNDYHLSGNSNSSAQISSPMDNCETVKEDQIEVTEIRSMRSRTAVTSSIKTRKESTSTTENEGEPDKMKRINTRQESSSTTENEGEPEKKKLKIFRRKSGRNQSNSNEIKDSQLETMKTRRASADSKKHESNVLTDKNQIMEKKLGSLRRTSRRTKVEANPSESVVVGKRIKTLNTSGPAKKDKISANSKKLILSDQKNTAEVKSNEKRPTRNVSMKNNGGGTKRKMDKFEQVEVKSQLKMGLRRRSVPVSEPDIKKLKSVTSKHTKVSPVREGQICKPQNEKRNGRRSKTKIGKLTRKSNAKSNLGEKLAIEADNIIRDVKTENLEKDMKENIVLSSTTDSELESVVGTPTLKKDKGMRDIVISSQTSKPESEIGNVKLGKEGENINIVCSSRTSELDHVMDVVESKVDSIKSNGETGKTNKEDSKLHIVCNSMTTSELECVVRIQTLEKEDAKRNIIVISKTSTELESGSATVNLGNEDEMQNIVCNTKRMDECVAVVDKGNVKDGCSKMKILLDCTKPDAVSETSEMEVIKEKVDIDSVFSGNKASDTPVVENIVIIPDTDLCKKNDSDKLDIDESATVVINQKVDIDSVFSGNKASDTPVVENIVIIPDTDLCKKSDSDKLHVDESATTVTALEKTDGEDKNYIIAHISEDCDDSVQISSKHSVNPLSDVLDSTNSFISSTSSKQKPRDFDIMGEKECAHKNITTEHTEKNASESLPYDVKMSKTLTDSCITKATNISLDPNSMKYSCADTVCNDKEIQKSTDDIRDNSIIEKTMDIEFRLRSESEGSPNSTVKETVLEQNVESPIAPPFATDRFLKTQPSVSESNSTSTVNENDNIHNKQSSIDINMDLKAQTDTNFTIIDDFSGNKLKTEIITGQVGQESIEINLKCNNPSLEGAKNSDQNLEPFENQHNCSVTIIDSCCDDDVEKTATAVLCTEPAQDIAKLSNDDKQYNNSVNILNPTNILIIESPISPEIQKQSELNRKTKVEVKLFEKLNVGTKNNPDSNDKAEESALNCKSNDNFTGNLEYKKDECNINNTNLNKLDNTILETSKGSEISVHDVSHIGVKEDSETVRNCDANSDLQELRRDVMQTDSITSTSSHLEEKVKTTNIESSQNSKLSNYPKETVSTVVEEELLTPITSVEQLNVECTESSGNVKEIDVLEEEFFSEQCEIKKSCSNSLVKQSDLSKVADVTKSMEMRPIYKNDVESHNKNISQITDSENVKNSVVIEQGYFEEKELLKCDLNYQTQPMEIDSPLDDGCDLNTNHQKLKNESANICLEKTTLELLKLTNEVSHNTDTGEINSEKLVILPQILATETFDTKNKVQGIDILVKSNVGETKDDLNDDTKCSVVTEKVDGKLKETSSVPINEVKFDLHHSPETDFNKVTETNSADDEKNKYVENGVKCVEPSSHEKDLENSNINLHPQTDNSVSNVCNIAIAELCDTNSTTTKVMGTDSSKRPRHDVFGKDRKNEQLIMCSKLVTDGKSVESDVKVENCEPSLVARESKLECDNFKSHTLVMSVTAPDKKLSDLIFKSSVGSTNINVQSNEGDVAGCPTDLEENISVVLEDGPQKIQPNQERDVMDTSCEHIPDISDAKGGTSVHEQSSISVSKLTEAENISDVLEDCSESLLCAQERKCVMDNSGVQITEISDAKGDTSIHEQSSISVDKRSEAENIPVVLEDSSQTLQHDQEIKDVMDTSGERIPEITDAKGYTSINEQSSISLSKESEAENISVVLEDCSEKTQHDKEGTDVMDTSSVLVLEISDAKGDTSILEQSPISVSKDSEAENTLAVLEDCSETLQQEQERKDVMDISREHIPEISDAKGDTSINKQSSISLSKGSEAENISVVLEDSSEKTQHYKEGTDVMDTSSVHIPVISDAERTQHDKEGTDVMDTSSVHIPDISDAKGDTSILEQSSISIEKSEAENISVVLEDCSEKPQHDKEGTDVMDTSSVHIPVISDAERTQHDKEGTDVMDTSSVHIPDISDAKGDTSILEQSSISIEKSEAENISVVLEDCSEKPQHDKEGTDVMDTSSVHIPDISDAKGDTSINEQSSVSLSKGSEAENISVVLEDSSEKPQHDKEGTDVIDTSSVYIPDISDTKGDTSILEQSSISIEKSEAENISVVLEDCSEKTQHDKEGTDVMDTSSVRIPDISDAKGDTSIHEQSSISVEKSEAENISVVLEDDSETLQHEQERKDVMDTSHEHIPKISDAKGDTSINEQSSISLSKGSEAENISVVLDDSSEKNQHDKEGTDVLDTSSVHISEISDAKGYTSINEQSSISLSKESEAKNISVVLEDCSEKNQHDKEGTDVMDTSSLLIPEISDAKGDTSILEQSSISVSKDSEAENTLAVLEDCSETLHHEQERKDVMDTSGEHIPEISDAKGDTSINEQSSISLSKGSEAENISVVLEDCSEKAEHDKEKKDIMCTSGAHIPEISGNKGDTSIHEQSSISVGNRSEAAIRVTLKHEAEISELKSKENIKISPLSSEKNYQSKLILNEQSGLAVLQGESKVELCVDNKETTTQSKECLTEQLLCNTEFKPHSSDLVEDNIPSRIGLVESGEFKDNSESTATRKKYDDTKPELVTNSADNVLESVLKSNVSVVSESQEGLCSYTTIQELQNSQQYICKQENALNKSIYNSEETLKSKVIEDNKHDFGNDSVCLKDSIITSFERNNSSLGNLEIRSGSKLTDLCNLSGAINIEHGEPCNSLQNDKEIEISIRTESNELGKQINSNSENVLHDSNNQSIECRLYESDVLIKEVNDSSVEMSSLTEGVMVEPSSTKIEEISGKRDLTSFNDTLSTLTSSSKDIAYDSNTKSLIDSSESNIRSSGQAENLNDVNSSKGESLSDEVGVKMLAAGNECDTKLCNTSLCVNVLSNDNTSKLQSDICSQAQSNSCNVDSESKNVELNANIHKCDSVNSVEQIECINSQVKGLVEEMYSVKDIDRNLPVQKSVVINPITTETDNCQNMENIISNLENKSSSNHDMITSSSLDETNKSSGGRNKYTTLTEDSRTQVVGSNESKISEAASRIPPSNLLNESAVISTTSDKSEEELESSGSLMSLEQIPSVSVPNVSNSVVASQEKNNIGEIERLKDSIIGCNEQLSVSPEHSNLAGKRKQEDDSESDVKKVKVTEIHYSDPLKMSVQTKRKVDTSDLCGSIDDNCVEVKKLKESYE